MPKTLLPDINVWLALSFDGHVHHPIAKTWFDNLSTDVCYFCRLTQLGFLRLATNPRVFGTNAVTLVEAWQKFDAFMSDPRVSFADEPVNIENEWRPIAQLQTFSPNVWNDAYLAAFAKTMDWELITFDKGLSRLSDARCSLLS